MFGYHDSNRCVFDLWSPVTTNQTAETADEVQDGYGVWESTPRHTAVENRAFGAYVVHQVQLDSIVEGIANGRNSISVFDDFSQEDVEYVQRELLNRYGINADISLE